MGVAIIDTPAYGKGTNISVTVNNTTINGAVYNYYVGDKNLKTGEGTSALAGAEQFNTAGLLEKTWTPNHDITLTIGALKIDIEKPVAVEATTGAEATGSNYRLAITSATDNSFTIAANSVFSGNITYVDKGTTKGAGFTVEAGSSGVTFSKGSITISGNIISGTATTTEIGEAIENIGAADIVFKDLTISGNEEIELPNVTVKGVVTIDSGVKVTSNAKITVDESSTLNVKGDVENADIQNNGEIAVLSKDAKIPSTISGTGSVDISSVSTEGTISGEYSTNTTFTKTQIITVTADTYLVDKAIFKIEGTLIIPEGVTLYIQDEARLVITGSMATLQVDGNIVIESAVNAVAGVSGAGALLVTDTAKAVNNGTIELAYSSASTSASEHPGMNISSTFVNNGDIIVGSESFLYIWGSNLTNAKDASIIIDGQIKLDDTGNVIYNAGEIIIDAIIFDNNLTIELTDADAVVDIVSATVKNDDDVNDPNYRTIIVKNSLVEPTGSNYYNDDADVSIAIVKGKTVTGIEITAQMVKDAGDNRNYTGYLNISGDLEIGNEEKAAGDVTVTFGNTIVSEDLIIGAGVAATFGKTIINGNVDVMTASRLITTFTINGDVTVNGVLTSAVAITINGSGSLTVEGYVYFETTPTLTNVNATYYVNKVGTKTTYVLTTFENAVAGMKDPTNTYATKNVTVYGNETVSDALVVVDNGVKVVFNDNTAKLTIGKDSVVTIADGSVINSTDSEIDVKGALVIENKKIGDKASAAIKSDVITQNADNNGYRIYSGLAYALENADEGAVVKLNQDITVSSSIAIPEGITVDATGKKITINAGKVLTVDGILSIDNGSTVDLQIDGDVKAEIVLNGIIKSSTENIYNLYKIAAAYYSINGVFYAEPVESVVAKIGEAYNNTVTIRGEVSVGDLTIVGSADKVANLVVADKLTAGTITVDEAKVTLNNNIVFNGTIADADGSIKFDGKTKADTVIASETVKDSKVLTVTGNIDATEKTMIILSGTVVIGAFVGDDVTINGDVTVSDNATATTLAVDGNVIIAKDKTLTTSDASVLGTIEMETNAKLTVNAGGKIVVGEPITSLGADGTIIGNIVLGDKAFVKVYAGSEVTETGSTTVITINGVDYATVYFSGDVLYKDVISKAELEKIPGYNVTYPFTDTSKIGVGEYDFVLVAKNVIVNISVDVGTKLQIGAYFYNQTTKGIEFKAEELTVIASVLPGYTGTAVAELWIDGKKVQDIDGSVILTPEMVDKEVVIVSTFGTAPGPEPTPVDPSEDYIVSTSVVDNNKVIVSVISLDGGYLVAGTEVEVTFTTLVETVAFGQTIYKPTPVTEIITIGDDKPTIDNSTYELADILGDKYAVINVMSTIGTTGYGNMSLNYKG